MTINMKGVKHEIDGKVYVCYMTPPLTNGRWRKFQTVKNLHDAAPELLDTLQEMLQKAKESGIDIVFPSTCEKARQAIAKAKGMD